MASGHGYRANRPNTWLLRPLLQSEDSSCQPGAVHTWPIADMLSRLCDIRRDPPRLIMREQLGRDVRFTPMCGRLRVGKENLHFAALVGAAMCSAC